MHKLLIIALIVLLALSMGYYYYIDSQNEINTELCISRILAKEKTNSIYVEVKNRGNSPIISGKASLKKKQTILVAIKLQCHDIIIQDFIEVTDNNIKSYASINFKLDGVNSIATITGTVNNQIEKNEVLSGFTTAINSTYNNWTIVHEITINPKVIDTENAVFITLLMSSLSNVKLTDITIEKGQLIVKGLVRDKLREQETMTILQQLFEGDLIINNQLKRVIIHDTKIEKLEIDLGPLPILEKPKSFSEN